MPAEDENQKVVAPGRRTSDYLHLFTAFDEAAREEAARPDPVDVDASLERLRALIDVLPQRQAISDEHAEKWLLRTYKMAIQRMDLEPGEGKYGIGDIHNHVLWHVRRASGIGGSEASTVLKHFRGKRGTFGDARTLVMEKLLILSPQPSTDVMARGVRAEQWIQKIYSHNTGARQDTESLAKLRDFRWEKRPAAIGTPDDIVLLDIDDDGQEKTIRRIVDYKAPSADVMEGYDRDGISFDYVCQDTHYGTIALAAGIQFDDMTIEALDPRSFRVVSFPVPFDVDLAKELGSAIDRLWNEHVMTADIPAAPKPDDLDVLDEEFINIGAEAAMLKMVEDDAKKRGADLKKRLSAASEAWHDVATGKFDLKFASYTRDRTWNETGLRGIAEQAGVDVSEFEKETEKLDDARAVAFMKGLQKCIEKNGDVDALLENFRTAGIPFEKKLDSQKLADKLDEMGISLVTAMEVRESLRISAKKKGPEFEKATRAREYTKEVLDSLETLIQDQLPVIMSDEEPENDEEMQIA